jgi:hypothetical protein
MRQAGGVGDQSECETLTNRGQGTRGLGNGRPTEAITDCAVDVDADQTEASHGTIMRTFVPGTAFSKPGPQPRTSRRIDSAVCS